MSIYLFTASLQPERLIYMKPDYSITGHPYLKTSTFPCASITNMAGSEFVKNEDTSIT